MPTLHLKPFLTEKEWQIVEKIARERNPRHGISNYLLMEIYSQFDVNKECETEDVPGKKRRHFQLELPPLVFEKVICQSKTLDISPTALIIKKIIDPILTPRL